MAYDPQKARIASQLLRQGLSDEQALRQAGVSPADFDFYAINEVAGSADFGNFERAFIGPGTQSSDPPRSDPRLFPWQQPGVDPVTGLAPDTRPSPLLTELPPNRVVTQQSTNTDQTTVSGGTVTTTRVTPTTYRDTTESRALQDSADDVTARKNARAAELRAQGKTGAQVLQDPEYRALSREAQDLEAQAQGARAVDQAGSISVTTTPGAAGVESSQTLDSTYITQRTAGEDAQVQQQGADNLSSSGSRVENSQPTSVDDLPGFVFDPNTGELVPADSVQAQEILFQEQRVQNSSATAGPGLFSVAFDPEGSEPNNFGVWDNARGVFVARDLTEPEAQRRAAQFNAGAADLGVSGAELAQNFRESSVDEIYSASFDPETNTWGVWANGQGAFVVTGLTEQEALLRAEELNAGDTLDTVSGVTGTGSQRAQDAAEAAANEAAIRERARVQATLANQIRQADSGDWRFKIRLAPGANYLYRGVDGQGVQSGILAPLAVTDGVIFPYTPNITTSYIARYAEQDLPHSNYRGYFYSGSYPEALQVQAVFTAQDTAEANYLLAVIHFFRSVTKMFYGQDDAFRGAPPPLVFLQGFGSYQYSRHPCVVTRFNLNLPADVDYIRADVQPITGLNIQQGRRPGGVPPQSLPTNVFTGALARLQNAGATKGAIFRPAAAETLGTVAPTYVPTKMDMTIELLPMQTRQQVSQGFNLRDYATGNLLRKGFW
jgi:hypothetical protein